MSRQTHTLPPSLQLQSPPPFSASLPCCSSLGQPSSFHLLLHNGVYHCRPCRKHLCNFCIFFFGLHSPFVHSWRNTLLHQDVWTRLEKQKEVWLGCPSTIISPALRGDWVFWILQIKSISAQQSESQKCRKKCDLWSSLWSEITK